MAAVLQIVELPTPPLRERRRNKTPQMVTGCSVMWQGMRVVAGLQASQACLLRPTGLCRLACLSS